jgi:hypothetical protein
LKFVEHTGCSNVCGWHLHQLDPSFAVPARHLDRPAQLDRLGRWLAEREQEMQV